MINNNSERKEETSWNILGKRAEFISNLLWSATNYLINYNWEKAFSRFSGLRELINCDLKEVEQLELDAIERKANFYISRYQILFNICEKTEEQNKEFQKMNNLCSKIVKEYQRNLMDRLKELGFFPTKTDERFLGGR